MNYFNLKSLVKDQDNISIITTLRAQGLFHDRSWVGYGRGSYTKCRDLRILAQGLGMGFTTKGMSFYTQEEYNLLLEVL